MRIRSLLLATAATGLFAACTRTEDKPVANPPPTPPVDMAKAPAPDDDMLPVQKPTATPGATGAVQGPLPPQNPDMGAAIQELMARPMIVTADQPIAVKHVLIAFQGAQQSRAKRSKDEANAQAKKVYAEAISGADFDALMKQSDDPGGGNYDQTRLPNFVQGFKDVAYRLRVGEIGVAPYDPTKTPHGWHIIKRVK